MIRLFLGLMLIGAAALGADTPTDELARSLRSDDPRTARSAVAAVVADERLVPAALAAQT